MIIEVRYAASSNISFEGTWEIEVDDQDWEEAGFAKREQMIAEQAIEKLLEDVGWSYDI